MSWKHTGGGEAPFHSFLTSMLDEGEWSTSRSGGFTLGEKSLYPLTSVYVLPCSLTLIGFESQSDHPSGCKGEIFYILYNNDVSADIYLRSVICSLLEEGLSNSHISSSRNSYGIRHKNYIILKFVGRIPNYVMTNLWFNHWNETCVT